MPKPCSAALARGSQRAAATSLRSSTHGDGGSGRAETVERTVIDAGIAIGWMHGRHRAGRKLDALFRASREGKTSVVISVVNLAEVLIHTAELSRATGVDAVALLTATGVRIHHPDEAIARRVARLRTSLADGFAAATAQELGARLHTTDAELVRQLRGSRLAVTHY